MGQLNTSNPESISWEYEQLDFTLLGGVKLEGLDRLRVTIKIAFRNEAIRHNLDLYNDTQVEKLVRKTAERFEMGTSYISKAINELINEVESYRIAEREAQAHNEPTARILTETERAEAIEFLKQDNLLEATNHLIGESGVIGEEENRLLMYLIFTSRKTSRPLHVVSFGSSGIGKSHLQEKVGELIPTEDKIEITSLTGNAFYYFDKDELGHKLILIEDLDGALSALYPIRELQSKQKISKTLSVKDRKGNTKTIHLVVHGPVSIAGCTTQEQIYEDNANRSFLIYLDESAQQDERVMDYQRKLSAGKIDQSKQQQIKYLLQNTQKVLEPLSVVNPYAELLALPKEVFKPRRTNAHYIAFIEAITFYRQYQRPQKAKEETGEIYIETTIEDIREANRLMKPILLRKSDSLSGAARSYLERLKLYLKGSKQATFTNAEIRKTFRENHSNQKRYMLELQHYGYVNKIEGDKKKGYQYEVDNYQEYDSLEKHINSALDKIIERIENLVVHRPQEVHRPNEPLNTLKKNNKASKTTEVQPK